MSCLENLNQKVQLNMNFFGAVLQVAQSFYPQVSRYSDDSKFLSSGVQVFRKGIQVSGCSGAQVALDCVLNVSPPSSDLPSAPLYQK